MKIKRRKTKTIKIGNICIGANYPIAIQSMTKTKTADVAKSIRQIKELENAGCEIVRLAVKDDSDVKALKEIKRHVNIPIVADIHFNWRFATGAIEAGVDKIRLNPGNIYKVDEIREVAKAASQAHIPIRVGVNSGSLRKCQSVKVSKCHSPVDRMVKSALDYIKVLEGFKFYDIVVSLKGSNIFDTIEAYRKIVRACDYPIHLGVTATGPSHAGVIKSSIAIGALLLEGVGDTIRVSLTSEPQAEVIAAKAILEAVGLRRFGPEIISCPTCGRCAVDLVGIVNDLDRKLSAKRYPLNAKPMKVAIMGCEVNGPGEAREADIGVAFGKKEGLLFRKGRSIKKVSFSQCIDTLFKEMEAIKCLRH